MKRLFTLGFLFYAALTFAQKDSLIAYWPLNGDGIDASGNGYNGILVGSVTPATDRFGISNSSLSINAADSYIDIRKAFKVDSTKGITVSYWSKNEIPVSTTTMSTLYNDVFSFYNQAKTERSLIRETTTRFNPTSSNEIICSLEVNTGGGRFYSGCNLNWNHFAVTIYIDPISGEKVCGIYKNNEYIGLGSSNGMTFFFRFAFAYVELGKIFNPNSTGNKYVLDDVRIHNKVLSAPEIDKLYNNQLITSYENKTLKQEEDKQLLKAVNLLGQEITNIESYSGAVILIYSNGSRKKVVK